MSKDLVNAGSANIDLEPSAINPDWVLEGFPRTRWKLLFKTDDGIAQTGVWDCTAGKFRWNYHCDETIHVIEGGMAITSGGTTKEVRAGDVIFFPAGSETVWTVHDYVRKVFWLRQPLPYPTGLMVRAFNRLRYRKYRSSF